jgi:hypothetical protein
MTIARRLPAVIVLVVLAILPIEAWSLVSRPPMVLRQPASGLDHITWAGTLRADGRLATATTYHFTDDRPALVGVVVGASGRGDRSALAGTLLDLAHRGVIRLDGLDAQRPQGQVGATATLTGPPLWGAGTPALERRLRRVGRLSARRAGLVRVTLSALVLLPATVAMGLVAVIGAGGLSALGWFAVFGGPVLALGATYLTGWSLTRSGQRQRDQWVGFGRWLRDNSELAEVGAPAVAVWGDVLAYAAVLGAAAAAARALSAHASAG